MSNTNCSNCISYNCVTNSSRGTFLDCQFKYFCEYVLRLSPRVEAFYFTWGNLVHLCEEFLDSGKSVDEAVEQFRCKIEKLNLSPARTLLIDNACNIMPDVIGGHQLRWLEHNKVLQVVDEYETLGSELKFDIILPSGWHFRGKIDRIVRNINTGEVILWEIKTASQVDNNYVTSLVLDSQPLGYLYAANHVLGFNATRVIYDIFVKPAIRLKKTESPEQFNNRLGEEYLINRHKYFKRYPVSFTKERIDNYVYEIDQVAETIQWHMIEGIWLKHHPRNRLGGCSFQSLCEHGVDSYDRINYNVRSPEEINPELDKLELIKETK